MDSYSIFPKSKGRPKLTFGADRMIVETAAMDKESVLLKAEISQ
jgi:hypothetical protein